MRIVGSFPSHLVPKTDEERIQNLFNKYKYNNTFSNYYWKVTEKLEGTSFSCLINENNEFIVCSRNHIVAENSIVYQDHMLENDNIYTLIAKKYKLEEKLRLMKTKYGLDLAIQGEIIGPGIQGNIYKLTEPELCVFNVWSILKQTKSYDVNTPISLINSEYHNLDDIEQFSKDLKNGDVVNLRCVPDLTEEFEDIINKFNNNTITLDELLIVAEGKSILNNKTEREGVVFIGAPINGPYKPISFKVISNKFLLKEK